MITTFKKLTMFLAVTFAGLIVAYNAAHAAPDQLQSTCTYKGTTYAHDANVCMNGRMYTCGYGGAWVDSGHNCQ